MRKTWRMVYDELKINHEDRRKSRYHGAWRHITVRHCAPGITPYEASRSAYINKHGKEPPSDKLSTRMNKDAEMWAAKAKAEIERMRALFQQNTYRDDLRNALLAMEQGKLALAKELALARKLNEDHIIHIDQRKIHGPTRRNVK